MNVQNDPLLIEVPMIVIRNNPSFPTTISSFIIGREQSLAALEKSLQTDKQVFIVMQKETAIEVPTRRDLYQMGTYGKIFQTVRLPNNMIKASFYASARAKWHYLDMQKEIYTSYIEVLPAQQSNSPEAQVLFNSTIDLLTKEIKQVQDVKDIITNKEIINLEKLADTLIPLLKLSDSEQQSLLEELDPHARLDRVYLELAKTKEYKKMESSLKAKVQAQLAKTQREYYLNEQLKVIHKELGHEGIDDFTSIQEKIKASSMPEEAKAIALKESHKLRVTQQTSAEANIARNYIDKLLSLPWIPQKQADISISQAAAILDKDHFGLEKIKERILEYIAVTKYAKNNKSTILCFIGPPGVGKTSFAKSIAKTLDREFKTISLGGVHDESEIRGHRRTYLGAMPGKIIQAISRLQSNNPVILLDEIDKMTQSAMGNPAAALLEVLDPGQNKTFIDHYIEVKYDLSQVFFLCTANNINDIPYALRDRLEIITLSGYTIYEKTEIAKQYLLPKLSQEYSLPTSSFTIPESVILKIIESYAREAGVRKLEQNLAKLLRKIVITKLKQEEAQEQNDHFVITDESLFSFLGAPKYYASSLLNKQEIGIASGLAWTPTGGEILPIEVNYMNGSGKIQLTGKLGDVMKESAQTALSYIKTNASTLHLCNINFNTIDIHIHVPAGAVPKDGPSAGVSISVALISALRQQPLHQTVALTGEVTLYGKVLAIGGLLEKLLAAQRYGIKTVLLPKQNEQDVAEIAKDVRKGLEIIFVSNINEILPHIFVTQQVAPLPLTTNTQNITSTSLF